MIVEANVLQLLTKENRCGCSSVLMTIPSHNDLYEVDVITQSRTQSLRDRGLLTISYQLHREITGEQRAKDQGKCGIASRQDIGMLDSYVVDLWLRAPSQTSINVFSVTCNEAT